MQEYNDETPQKMPRNNYRHQLITVELSMPSKVNYSGNEIL